jgi:nucleotidyltransferase/DNA polymerase involved in DNA repair
MVKLTDVAGIGPVAAKLLTERNIKTVAALASISLAELQKIPGFNGEIRARAVKKAASDCLHAVTKQSAVPAKPVKAAQTPVNKIVSEKTKTSQALSPIEAETSQAANKKKDKKDSKKKEKIKDKDKDKKDKNKKHSKKKGKNKKK